MTLIVVPRNATLQIYRNGYLLSTAAVEEGKRIYHSDDGPILVVEKSALNKHISNMFDDHSAIIRTFHTVDPHIV